MRGGGAFILIRMLTCVTAMHRQMGPYLQLVCVYIYTIVAQCIKGSLLPHSVFTPLSCSALNAAYCLTNHALTGICFPPNKDFHAATKAKNTHAMEIRQGPNETQLFQDVVSNTVMICQDPLVNVYLKGLSWLNKYIWSIFIYLSVVLHLITRYNYEIQCSQILKLVVWIDWFHCVFVFSGLGN